MKHTTLTDSAVNKLEIVYSNVTLEVITDCTNETQHELFFHANLYLKNVNKYKRIVALTAIKVINCHKSHLTAYIPHTDILNNMSDYILARLKIIFFPRALNLYLAMLAYVAVCSAHLF